MHTDKSLPCGQGPRTEAVRAARTLKPVAGPEFDPTGGVDFVNGGGMG